MRIENSGGCQNRAGEKDVIDSESVPQAGQTGLGEFDKMWGMGKVCVTQTQASYHHILSPIEEWRGIPRPILGLMLWSLLWISLFQVFLTTVLNIIRNIVTEVREWDSHVRDWVLESLLSMQRCPPSRCPGYQRGWDPE